MNTDFIHGVNSPIITPTTSYDKVSCLVPKTYSKDST